MRRDVDVPGILLLVTIKGN